MQHPQVTGLLASGLAGAELGQVIGFRGQPPSPLTRAVFPKQNIQSPPVPVLSCPCAPDLASCPLAPGFSQYPCLLLTSREDDQSVEKKRKRNRGQETQRESEIEIMRETERGPRGRERPTDSLCPPVSVGLALIPPVLTFPQSYDILSCLPLPPSPADHRRNSPPATPSPPNTVPHLANSCSTPFLQEALPVSTAPF